MKLKSEFMALMPPKVAQRHLASARPFAHTHGWQNDGAWGLGQAVRSGLVMG